MTFRNKAVITAVLGSALLPACCNAQGRTTERIQPRVLEGDDGTYWKGCEEIQPINVSESNASYWLCVDKDKKQFDVVKRLISHNCTATVPADKRDNYQHFSCVDQVELLIRPHKDKASEGQK